MHGSVSHMRRVVDGSAFMCQLRPAANTLCDMICVYIWRHCWPQKHPQLLQQSHCGVCVCGGRTQELSPPSLILGVSRFKAPAFHFGIIAQRALSLM